METRTATGNEIKDDSKPKFDLSEAMKLRLKHGLSFGQLAVYYGIPKPTIHSKLRSLIRVLGDADLNRLYAEQRAEVLNGTERLLISHLIDADKLKSATLNNVAYAFQQVHTARRLEEDLSTANVSSKMQVRDLTKEAKDRLDVALKAMYQPGAQQGKVEGPTASPVAEGAENG